MLPVHVAASIGCTFLSQNTANQRAAFTFLQMLMPETVLHFAHLLFNQRAVSLTDLNSCSMENWYTSF